MKYFSLFMLLILFIICTGADSYAAEMQYSMQFEVGVGTTFNGSSVTPDTVATIELIGDTEDIQYWMTDPPDNPDEMPDFMGSEEFSLSSLNGILRLGVEEYGLTDPWLVQTYYAFGESNFSIHFRAWETAYQSVGPVVFDSGEGDIFLDIEQQIQGETPGGGISVLTGGGLLSCDPWAVIEIQYESRAVPIPSAVWLLGSGLIGLVGFRKKLRK